MQINRTQAILRQTEWYHKCQLERMERADSFKKKQE